MKLHSDRRSRGVALVAAVGISLVAASASVAAVVPPGTHARIHALTAPYDYLPAKVPAGLIYVNWKSSHPSALPTVCGDTLSVTFAAAGGKQIQWSASRDCDGRGRVGCFNNGYPGYGFGMPVDQRATINGRLVFFSQGNHGSNAWTCIPTKTGGVNDMAVAGIWESGFITPRAAMQLVASARR